MKRRSFLQTGSVYVLGSTMLPSALKAAGKPAPSDAIRIGAIGINGMGWADLKAMLKVPGTQCVALCDVDKSVLDTRAAEVSKNYAAQPTLYNDYRKLLEDKNIDAVIIGTPDHWHCNMLADACAASKDVYVEKPAGNSIAECRAMVAAQQKYNRIVQVGQWQRSQKHFSDAVAFVHSGKLGQVRLVKVWAYQGWMKSIPVKPDSTPPPGVDYDLWLGPAQKRAFNPNRFHFNFRWYWDYAGGLMTDWGVHLVDYALLGMKAPLPKSVMAAGGKFAYPDDAEETPDTLTTVYEFDGFNMLWEHATGINGGPYGRDHGIAFIGNNGTLVLDRAATLIAELTGGTIDDGMTDVYPNLIPRKKVTMRYERARKIIGVDISDNEMASLLLRLYSAKIETNTDSLIMEVPSYRVDISEEIDLIEEVARLYNYDNISADLSSKFPSGIELASEFAKPSARNIIRAFFTERGFNEIVTYSFLDKPQAALFTDNPIELANPLGEEFSVMRPSMLPAMMRTVEHNLRNGQTMMRLFDIGKTFHRSTEQSFIPGILEQEHLCYVQCGYSDSENWSGKTRNIDFYDIKGISEELLSSLNISNYTVSSHDAKGIFSINALDILCDGISVGTVGEVSAEYRSMFGIDSFVFAAEINLSKLYIVKTVEKKYKPVPHFPAVKRDVAFVVDSTIDAGAIQKALVKSGGQLLQSVRVFDVFEGKSLGEGKKSLAFSLTFQSSERTLVEQEVGEAVSKMVKEVERSSGGKLRE